MYFRLHFSWRKRFDPVPNASCAVNPHFTRVDNIHRICLICKVDPTVIARLERRVFALMLKPRKRCDVTENFSPLALLSLFPRANYTA